MESLGEELEDLSIGKALWDTGVAGLEFRGARQGLLLPMPLGSDARKGSVGSIPSKPWGIKCGLEARGAPAPCGSPFHPPQAPRPLSPTCLGGATKNTLCGTSLPIWIIFYKLTLSQPSPLLPSLSNDFPLQRVPFAVGAAWEWHQKATGSSPTQSGT